jgi:hypothetical protein
MDSKNLCLSFEHVLGVRTILFSVARFAVYAHPQRVELLYDPVQKFIVIGNDPSLEVSACFALGTHPRPGQIRTARIGEDTIDNDGLEMRARA